MTKIPQLKLSVLDQSPIRSGGSAVESINESIELAKACEAAGYNRYWLAEHHGTPSLAGPAPEIMITRIAAETKTIRVGSGGVMLGHYSPLKVAETFSVLESLYPGRIDLGIGRAPGSDQLTAAALAYGSEIGVQYFPTRVADLMAFLGNGEPSTKDFKRIKIVPKPNKPPQLWMLGSSDQSALMAAQFGLAFSFAHFIVQEGGKRVLEDYRQRFQKSDFYDQPDTSLCIFIVCAKTEKDARKLALCRDLVLLLRERGEIGPFPSIKEAEAYDYTELDQSIIERNRPKSLYGDPNQCRKLIETISTEYGVNEVVILSICHDPDARRKSYELIADAFN